jgi:hypothetical protein
MKFFGKKEDTPPDVGQEESVEAQTEEDSGGEEEEVPQLKNFSKQKQGDSEAVSGDFSRLELEKISGRLETITTWINQFYEVFSRVSQSIGEVRAMNLETEKKISEYSKDALRAVDVVNEVKPEMLRLDYQKADMKMETLGEKIEANKQFVDNLMKEVKELRRMQQSFLATEALLELTEQTKKDLLTIQQLGSRVKLDADRTEQVFIESKREMIEVDKLAQNLSSMEASYSGVKKELENLRLDYRKVVNVHDFDDLRRSFNNKITILGDILQEFDSTHSFIRKISELMETTAFAVKRNKEDIADLAVTVGNGHIQRVANYENQLDAVLKIVDTLAGQVNELKSRCGWKVQRIAVGNEERAVEDGALNLKHIEVHPELSKHFISGKEEREADEPPENQRFSGSFNSHELKILEKVPKLGKDEDEPFKKSFPKDESILKEIKPLEKVSKIEDEDKPFSKRFPKDEKVSRTGKEEEDESVKFRNKLNLERKEIEERLNRLKI